MALLLVPTSSPQLPCLAQLLSMLLPMSNISSQNVARRLSALSTALNAIRAFSSRRGSK
jgi:hypothetical protein